MAKTPQVLFYNIDDSLVNIPDIGHLGDYLYKFSYKYSETETDEGEIILAFTHTSVPLTFMQPGIVYKIKWGYLGGDYSNVRTVAVKAASYKYSTAGFIVSLKIVPQADYDLTGTLRDAAGITIEEVQEDTTKEVGKFVWVYDALEGTQIKIWQSDGELDSSRNNPRGFVEPEKAVASVVQLEAPPRETDLDEWYTNYDLYEKYNYGDFYVRKDGDFNNLSKDTWRSPLYDENGTPYITRENPNIAPASFKFNITNREAEKVIAATLRYDSSRKVMQVRDDKITEKEIDWGVAPVFTITVGREVINFDLAKSDKEARIIQQTVTTSDPTTGEITTSHVTVAKAIDILASTQSGEYAVKFTYYQEGDNFYMLKKGADEAEKRKIERETYGIRKRQLVLKEKIKEDYNVTEEQIETLIHDLKDKDGNPASLEDIRQYQWRQSAVARKLEIEKGSPITRDDVKKGFVQATYSGKTASQVEAENIKEEMDKLFYNSKLTLKIEGAPHVEDAVNFSFLAGGTELTGVYHIDESEHIISKAGYVTNITSYRVVLDYKQVVARIKKETGEDLEEIKKAEMDYNILDVEDQFRNHIDSAQQTDWLRLHRPFQHHSQREPKPPLVTDPDSIPIVMAATERLPDQEAYDEILKFMKENE